MKAQQTLTLQLSEFSLNRITVKKAMLDANLRIIDLATRFQVHPSTISLTIAGKTRNLAIQKAIATALKLPLESLRDMAPPTRKRKRSVRPSSESSAASSAALAASSQSHIGESARNL